MSFTLGVVPYLNALPLYRTLEMGGSVEVLRSVPAQLSQQLASAQCDVALIPIVEHFRGVGEGVISDSCIGSNGAVRSVLLFTRAPMRAISSVAVDTSSRTSVALLRVLLVDGYGVQPRFVEHPPDLEAMLAAHDAALLIGDNALEAVENATRNAIGILDLGAIWTKKVAQKPFVYAAWVTRRGLDEERAQELGAVLNTARDEGLQRLSEIVATNPIPSRLSNAQIEDYLRHAVEFHLTPEHRAGMEEFRRRCEAHGLL
jgi:chorismate dehydratase